jgi:ribosomal protein L4
MKGMDGNMPTTKIYDMQGKVVGEATLSEAIFGVAPNNAAIHAVIKNHLANKRQGTQSALKREPAEPVRVRQESLTIRTAA